MTITTKKLQYLSYLVSFLVYTFLINWKVAALLVVGIGFHECGHLFAARKLGLNTAGFFLIPMMGGIAFITSNYRAYYQKIIVALSGPIAGILLSLVCYGVGLLVGSPFMLVGALWMLLLNGFNLLPLAVLDGGQVAEAITYSINETVGLAFLTISTVVAVVVLGHYNFFLALIILYISGKNLLTQYQGWKIRKRGFGSMIPPLPKKMCVPHMVLSIASYLALVSGVLLLAMLMYHNPGTHTSLF